MVDSLLKDEGVTFKELDELYKQCKQSLNEFFQVFHNKTDALKTKDLELFLNLAQVQGISKDIHTLSSRVIELESKIESVAKTLITCDKDKTGHCVACDRKTLPVTSNSLKPKVIPTSSSLPPPSETPFLMQEPVAPSAERKGALRGGHIPSKSRTTPSKKPKEVTWLKQPDCSQEHKANAMTNKSPNQCDQKHSHEPVTRDSSTMTTHSKSHYHHHPHHHQHCSRGPSQLTTETLSLSPPTQDSDSQVKLSKLIPELLSKFEEFHHSFSRACDHDKHIEPSTAAEILKVMDGHLKLLECLEARLRSQGKQIVKK